MAHTKAIYALALVVATPSLASVGEPAPAGTAETKYCMKIEAITGTRLEEVKCWTREEWAAEDVDVDAEWATEGVRTIG